MAFFLSTTNFSVGEVDSALVDRVDSEGYANAASLLENWLPDLAGAVRRRPGWAVSDCGSALFEATDQYSYQTEFFSYLGEDYLVLLSVEGTDFRVRVLRIEAAGCDFNVVPTEDVTFPIDEDLQPEYDPDLPLVYQTDTASAGPALFIASAFHYPIRVFYSFADSELKVEETQWYEQLLGTAEVSDGSDSWSGTDTLWQEQLSTGDTFDFGGQTFTVASISSNTAMTTDETYSGLSVSGVKLTKPIAASVAFGSRPPRLVTFTQGRLHLFTSTEYPSRWWASSAGDPYTIRSNDVQDDDPIEYDLLTDQADEFRWVHVSDNIYLGGSRATYAIFTASSEALGVANFSFERVASIGGAAAPAFGVESQTVFVGRGGTQIMAVGFSDSRQGFVDSDLTFQVPHLMEAGVQEMAYRPPAPGDRMPRLFALTRDNELRGAAVRLEDGINAWGRLPYNESDRLVSIASTTDYLYGLFERSDGGSFNYFLARLDFDQQDYWTMDFVREYTVDETHTVDVDPVHKDRDLVVIQKGGGILGYFKASGTTLDLEEVAPETGALGDIVAGGYFRSRLDMLPVYFGEDGQGGSLNRRRRLIRAILSLQETRQLIVNEVPLLGSVGTTFGAELPPNSGVFEQRQLGWDYRDELRIEGASVYRAEVRSITREVSI